MSVYWISSAKLLVQWRNELWSSMVSVNMALPPCALSSSSVLCNAAFITALVIMQRWYLNPKSRRHKQKGPHLTPTHTSSSTHWMFFKPVKPVLSITLKTQDVDSVSVMFSHHKPCLWSKGGGLVKEWLIFGIIPYEVQSVWQDNESRSPWEQPLCIETSITTRAFITR